MAAMDVLQRLDEHASAINAQAAAYERLAQAINELGAREVARHRRDTEWATNLNALIEVVNSCSRSINEIGEYAHSHPGSTAQPPDQIGKGLATLASALTEHARAAIAFRELAPAPVINVTTPPRRTEGTVERDAQGRLLRTTTIEKDL